MKKSAVFSCLKSNTLIIWNQNSSYNFGLGRFLRSNKSPFFEFVFTSKWLNCKIIYCEVRFWLVEHINHQETKEKKTVRRFINLIKQYVSSLFSCMELLSTMEYVERKFQWKWRWRCFLFVNPNPPFQMTAAVCQTDNGKKSLLTLTIDIQAT